MRERLVRCAVVVAVVAAATAGFCWWRQTIAVSSQQTYRTAVERVADSEGEAAAAAFGAALSHPTSEPWQAATACMGGIAIASAGCALVMRGTDARRRQLPR